MNIHFKDKELLKKLESATLFKATIGSQLYGTNDQDSDFDYLHIYVPSINERNSFKQSHHQLQFKGDNEDLNFCSIDVFLTNLLNGDSVVNFEIVNSKQLLNSPLKYLYENRLDFYNYKVLRSFLGIARRDLKEIGKQKNLKDKGAKLGHAFRGLDFAIKILNGKKLIFPLNEEIKKEIALYKGCPREEYITAKRSFFDFKITQLRNTVNERLNDKTLNLPNFMSVDRQKALDEWLFNLKSSEEYKNKGDWGMDLTEFYKLNEDVVIKYDKN